MNKILEKCEQEMRELSKNQTPISIKDAVKKLREIARQGNFTITIESVCIDGKPIHEGSFHPMCVFPRKNQTSKNDL